jgi:hypothetical protein
MIVLAYGHGFVTYLWHYLVARLIYDDVVRPLTRGDGGALLIAASLAAVAASLVARRRGRRRRF